MTPTGATRSSAPVQGAAPLRRRRLAIGVSYLAAAVYLTWRLLATVAGVPVILASAFVIIESWFWVRHVVVTWPAFRLRPSGAPVHGVDVPPVDVVVVARDEPVSVLAVTLRSAMMLRGCEGVALLNHRRRRDVAEVADLLGVRAFDPGEVADLGTAPGGVADLVAIVPGDAWISVNVGLHASAAFDDPDVAAVTFSNPVHGTLPLVGARGYERPVHGSDRLAALLDSAGAPTAAPGPILCSKDALRRVGGVPWEAQDPALAARALLSAAGWRTRFVVAPGWYRMAPANEAVAQRRRMLVTSAWRDARRFVAARLNEEPAGRQSHEPGWVRWVRVSASMERWSVIVRLLLVVVLATAVAVGSAPFAVGATDLVTIAAPCWFAFWLGQRLALGTRGVPAERLRADLRCLGADLLALRRRPATEKAVVHTQNALLVGFLGLVVGTVGAAITSDVRPSPENLGYFLCLAAVLGLVPLVRDAVASYRQRRVHPRAGFEATVRGELVSLSPAAAEVLGNLRTGSVHELDLQLPLPDGATFEATVRAVVQRTIGTGDRARSLLRLETDRLTELELAYFCGVTAPSMRWFGFEPRPAKRLAVPMFVDTVH